MVYSAPAACPCCGGALHKLSEDITESLELVPRQWKVVQRVREKFSCLGRDNQGENKSGINLLIIGPPDLTS